MILNIVLGTNNPAKTKSVKNAFNKMNLEYNLNNIAVDSEVRDMPLSDKEILQGSINRAYNALKKYNQKTDYSIGIEGGIIKFEKKYFVKGWISIYNGKEYSNASTISLPFPKKLGDYIFKDNVELGPLMDKLIGRNKINEDEGSVGLMTENLISRSHSFELALIAGFMYFKNEFFYKTLPGKISDYTYL